MGKEIISKKDINWGIPEWTYSHFTRDKSSRRVILSREYFLRSITCGKDMRYEKAYF